MSKVRRMNHIFRKDKRTFIVAMEHGSNMNVLPYLKEPGHIISELAENGVDAFLTTVGLMEKFGENFGKAGCILRVDGGYSMLGEKNKPLSRVYNVEDGLRFGADGVICMHFPGSKWEEVYTQALAENISAGEKWGMPVVAEALPNGFEKGPAGHTKEGLLFACRMAAEMGADIIKTKYTGDTESFKELVDSVYVPVVILGGDKEIEPKVLFTEIREALDAGAAGVAMGRNIWRHKTPGKLAKAISALIHDDVTVEEALKIFNN